MDGWFIDFLRDNPEIKEVSVQKWASYKHPEKMPSTLLISISINDPDSDTDFLRFYRQLVDVELLEDDNMLLEILNEMLKRARKCYARDKELIAKWSDQNG